MAATELVNILPDQNNCIISLGTEGHHPIPRFEVTFRERIAGRRLINVGIFIYVANSPSGCPQQVSQN